MSVHILGIRHHGPGSARNVRAFLEQLQPDIVLIEGPPEADGLIQWAGHADLQPPVAILAYQPDSPQKACFYPFAAFSPEWQAMLYAREHNIHARFMDLPLAHVFGLDNEAEAKAAADTENGNTSGEDGKEHLNDSQFRWAATGVANTEKGGTSGEEHLNGNQFRWAATGVANTEKGGTSGKEHLNNNQAAGPSQGLQNSQMRFTRNHPGPFGNDPREDQPIIFPSPNNKKSNENSGLLKNRQDYLQDIPFPTGLLCEKCCPPDHEKSRSKSEALTPEIRETHDENTSFLIGPDEKFSLPHHEKSGSKSETFLSKICQTYDKNTLSFTDHFGKCCGSHHEKSRLKSEPFITEIRETHDGNTSFITDQPDSERQENAQKSAGSKSSTWRSKTAILSEKHANIDQNDWFSEKRTNMTIQADSTESDSKKLEINGIHSSISTQNEIDNNKKIINSIDDIYSIISLRKNNLPDDRKMHFCQGFSPKMPSFPSKDHNNLIVNNKEAFYSNKSLNSLAFYLSAAENEEEIAETLPVEAQFAYQDPISHLAEAAGYDDGERWWEHMFEYRQDQEQVFDAVHDAMKALREELPRRESRREKLREAWMRKCIRQAEKEMFQRIAVICGAWHAPALQEMPKQKEDNDLLKGLPKAKVECTWIPWTYSRLSYESGYGAGIPSPGWYEHIWEHPKDDGTRWMALVARLFREQQQDTSVAHVMEAVRLANALASLRHFSRPGLEELNEATLAVLCNGESILMQLIRDELIVRNKIGSVPSEVPIPPLQADITRLQKKLRLPQTADFKDYTLDLRKDTDLDRSIFLHRLQLLGINWGQRFEVSGKGTFKEQWRLQWDPSYSIDIIEKGNWGNTVGEAASRYVTHTAQNTTTLPQVCSMLESAIPAELPAVVDVLIQRINNLAAASGDVLQLMEVIPSLVNISRYGNVRKTDAALVNSITESMIGRICISLPSACTAIADDAALPLLDLFFAMNDAIGMLQVPDLAAAWQATLKSISGNSHSAPMIAGYATRLLFDTKAIDGNTLARTFSVSMSVANPPASAAAWLEGFLRGSGTLLLLDEELWNMVYNWAGELENDIFIQVLPLLRRTFSNFTAPERKKLGDKVKHGGASTGIRVAAPDNIDSERGNRGIPIVMQLLGLADFKSSSDGA